MHTTTTGSRPRHLISKSWSIPFLVSLMLFGATGCSYLCDCEQNAETKENTVISSGETVYSDKTASAPTTSNANTSVAAPTTQSVTNTYPLGTSGEHQSYSIVEQPIAQAAVTQSVPQTAPQTASQTNLQSTATNATSPGSNQTQAACPQSMTNHYKKTVAFVSFPRTAPTTSRLGALDAVEQQLPLLIGGNLTNRHAVLTPIYLREGFISTNVRGEADTAVQVQILSHRHQVQFFVSGEVDDMTMSTPSAVESPSYYSRFVNGVHNLVPVNSSLDNRDRAFGFKVEVRDGFTGQIVFSNQYRTVGKWKPAPQADVGFGTSQFWETDYGDQIQHLVAKASDDMAQTINCQPYVARVESTPGQQQVVIQSGSLSGLHLGDTLDLYQLVHQPISGQYQRFDTRLIKRNGYIHLTETYPSHSVGRVVDATLLGGQYLIKAR